MATDPPPNQESGAPPPTDGLRGPLEIWRDFLAGLEGARRLRLRWDEESQRVADLRRDEATRGPRYRFKRTLSAGLGIFLSFFLGSLLIDFLEPFGVGTATKAHSSRISARLMAPFYESRGHDRIAVVLIDQDTLDARGQAWPPRYDYYENVIRRILRQAPRSIYFDILTSDLRPYDDSLGDARLALGEELADSKVPLWFGVISPYARSVFSNVPGAATAVAGWQGHGADYPLAIYPPHFTLDNQPSQGRQAGIYRADSAAYTLYREACLGAPSICGQDVPPLRDDQAEEPMVLFWGWSRPGVPSELLPKLGQCVRAAGAEARFLERLKASASGAWNDFWSGSEPQRLDAHRERCPPILTILEHQLDDPDIAALLADRVVLVGTRLAALDDSIVSPVHQRIPGVYMHAMALDNLMTWGEDRLYRDGLVLKVAAWISALLMSLAVAWILRSYGGIFRRLALLGAAFVGALGSIALLQFVLRQPPLDWLGSLALLVFVIVAMRIAMARQA